MPPECLVKNAANQIPKNNFQDQTFEISKDLIFRFAGLYPSLTSALAQLEKTPLR